MQPSLSTPEAFADIAAIVQQVFATMSDLEVLPTDRHPPAAAHEPIVSMLRYSEPSAGAILIACSPKLAYTFTARLMEIETPVSLDADVIDAIGELTNTIGGNLKALMPEETAISMPAVLTLSEQVAVAAELPRHILSACFALGPEHCCITLLGATGGGGSGEMDPVVLSHERQAFVP